MQSSSFVRKGAVQPTGDTGVRPGSNGQNVISSGLGGLDRLLGGGLPLGSLVLVEETNGSILSDFLIKYFLAEGVACGQSIFLASAGVESLDQFLPAQVQPSAEREAPKEEDAGHDLKIAWQYRRYLNKPAVVEEKLAPPSALSAQARELRQSLEPMTALPPKAAAPRAHGSRCHAFDLLRPSSPASLAACSHELLSLESLRGAAAWAAVSEHAALFLGRVSGAPATQPELWALPRPLLPPRSASQVARLALQVPGETHRDLLRRLLALRARLRSAQAVALVCIHAPISKLHAVQAVADGVLRLEAVADGAPVLGLLPESAAVAGMVRVTKLPSLVGALPLPEPATHVWRDRRRRVSLTPLQIDPVAEMKSGQAADAKPTAALLCGKPSNAQSNLDF